MGVCGCGYVSVKTTSRHRHSVHTFVRFAESPKTPNGSRKLACNYTLVWRLWYQLRAWNLYEFTISEELRTHMKKLPSVLPQRLTVWYVFSWKLIKLWLCWKTRYIFEPLSTSANGKHKIETVSGEAKVAASGTNESRTRREVMLQCWWLITEGTETWTFIIKSYWCVNIVFGSEFLSG